MKKLHLLVLLLTVSFLAACSKSEMQQETPPPTVEAQSDYHFSGVKRVDSPETRGVALLTKLWHQDVTIRIKFLSGTAAQQAEVKQVGEQWLEYANLNFEWIETGEADVRIAIDNDRRISWSTIGTDCRLIPQDTVPTMNLAYSALLDEGARHGAILRAFGQMLGLELEHRHLDLVDSWIVGIELIAPALYPDIPFATFKEYVMDPLTDRVNVTQTEYDPQSIMVWGFPLGFVVLKDGYAAPQVDNKVLSATDKAFISQLYGTPVEDYILISPLEQSVAATAGTFRMAILSNSNWSLSLPSWMTPSKTSGTGNDEITITVTANPGPDARSGNITGSTPGGQSAVCEVTQAAPEYVTFSRISYDAPAQQSSFELIVSSNTTWTLSSPEWCVLSSTSGTGNATIQVTVLANTTAIQRSGYISPTANRTNTCRVVQEGETAFTFSPASFSVGNTGGGYDLRIESNTEWTLTAPSWITLGATSGSGNATVRVTVAQNEGIDPRTGNITATYSTGSANCPVTQAAQPSYGGMYDIRVYFKNNYKDDTRVSGSYQVQIDGTTVATFGCSGTIPASYTMESVLVGTGTASYRSLGNTQSVQAGFTSWTGDAIGAPSTAYVVEVSGDASGQAAGSIYGSSLVGQYTHAANVQWTQTSTGRAVLEITYNIGGAGRMADAEDGQ